MARIREIYRNYTGASRLSDAHDSMCVRVCMPLIILYTEVSYTHASGGMRSATVDNDNRTRDDVDGDDDALLFFTTHENTRWREEETEKKKGAQVRGSDERWSWPDTMGHAKLKFHPTTQKRSSRDLLRLSFSLLSLCPGGFFGNAAFHASVEHVHYRSKLFAHSIFLDQIIEI